MTYARGLLKYAAPLRNMPVRAFHGATDSVVPTGESQKMIDALRDIGGDAQLTILPDTGHEAWQKVYGDPQFYEWLLRQSVKEGAK